MNIVVKHEESTVYYAKEEIMRYLKLIDNNALISDIEISLGLLEDFGLSTDDVNDKFYDDVVDIDIKNGSGYIAGSNPRSVLYGVYEYLKSMGCMWVRPGIDGEYIPQCDIENHSFKYRKKADTPIRMQMIEGALKFEFIADFVLWMPKVGFNAFYMQFVYPYEFFRRWWHHDFNSVKEKEPFNEQMVEVYVNSIEHLVKKCGMMLFSVGHGHLFEAYGVKYRGKVGVDEGDTIPEKFSQHIAQVNGKREVFRGSINFTQLCLSNPETRKNTIDYLVSFMKSRPYVDALRVGMADASGNICECENCRKKTDSDWRVVFLNELDEEFTKNGINCKLGVGAYNSTFWPPVEEKIKNPDRYLFNIGISTSYYRPLQSEYEIPELPENIRNHSNFPEDVAMRFASIKGWSEHVGGKFLATAYDCFFIHYADPGLHQLSKREWEDFKVYHEIEGFNGIISCQTQRIGFPTALPNCIMGGTLYDKDLDFEQYSDKYYTSAFGEDGLKVKEYLKEISKRFDPSTIMLAGSIVNLDTGTGEEDKTVAGYLDNPEAQKRFKSISSLVDEFKTVVEANLSAENKCHRKSWELLHYHGTFCKKFAELYYQMSVLDVEKSDEVYDDMMNWLSENEDAFAQHFDLCIFARRNAIVRRQAKEYAENKK